LSAHAPTACRLSGACAEVGGYSALPAVIAAPLAQRLLNIILFVTVIASAIAFIEPSPHDALMAVLTVSAVAARVRFDRGLIPLVLLLCVWIAGGLASLIQVVDQQQTVQYAGTSAYLAVAAIVFACLFDDGDPVRLLILRRGYVIAALIAAAAGFTGFFHLVPHSDMFIFNDRVSATFKDPNVFGPFLIYPMLLLLVGLLTRGVRVLDFLMLLMLIGGLLLSFSRGAWIHFALSAAVAIAVLVVVTPNARIRSRIVFMTVGAAIIAAIAVAALIAVPAVHDLLRERASAFQPYDVGPGGRFWLQQIALEAILDHPNGMGPFEFSRVFGGQQHDVYMQGFLVYGWLGGAAYATLVIVTLAIGLRGLSVPAPWQHDLIAAYGAFVGEAGEGFIIDTDHWRHFFLILGLVWGLTAASIRRRRLANAEAFSRGGAAFSAAN
jgi:hypothetical protein